MLCFGVVRPYKGVDVLLEAFRRSRARSCGWSGARSACRLERARVAPAERSASCRATWPTPSCPPSSAAPTCWCSRTATVDVSGVLFAGLAFGKPMVLSDVGGFREVVRGPRRRPAGPARAIPRALARRHRASCWPTRPSASGWRERARAAAAGPYSWDRSPSGRSAVYEEVLAGEGRVHGQAQALRGARARLAGGARRARCCRGRRAGARRAAPRAAAARPRRASATGCRS